MNSAAATVMPFGKHRGKTLAELDAGYLSWLGSKLHELRDPLRAAIAAEIARRKATTPVQGVVELEEPSPSSPVCSRCDRPGTVDHPLIVHANCAEVPF